MFAKNHYEHGNEPSHHLAYLYDYAGQPWKTQDQVRRIAATEYGTGPDGLSGNDDCGQMSAWFVLSALGFYPVCPGVPNYEIGSPMFPEAVVHLPAGKDLIIRAVGVSSKNRYIKSIHSRKPGLLTEISCKAEASFSAWDRSQTRPGPVNQMTLRQLKVGMFCDNDCRRKRGSRY